MIVTILLNMCLVRTHNTYGTKIRIYHPSIVSFFREGSPMVIILGLVL